MANILAPNILNTVDVTQTLKLVLNEDDATDCELTLAVFRIFVPSDYGGILKVSFKEHIQDLDASLAVIGPDGTVHTRTSTTEIGLAIRIRAGTVGSGEFRAVVHSPNAQFSIYAVYTESGHARDAEGNRLVPWNFWYFPFARNLDKKASAFNLELWEPLTKYEAAFGVTGVEAWEEEHHSDLHGKRNMWEGHCAMIAPASIIFEAPPVQSAAVNGIRFTDEEVKLLLGEVVGNHANFGSRWVLPEKFNKGGKDERLKPVDAPRRFAPALMSLLRRLRVDLGQNGRPLVMDLRDEEGVSAASVWNHVVYEYETMYRQFRSDDLRLVRGHTIVTANGDFCNHEDGSSTGLPTEGGAVKREFVYTARFRRNGTLHDEIGQETHGDDRWDDCRSAPKVSVHAPRHAFTVLGLVDEPNASGRGNRRVRLADVLRLARRRKLP